MVCRKRTGWMMLFFSLSILLLLLSGCGTKNTEPLNEGEKSQGKAISSDEYPIVTIIMEDDSKIKVELYPDKAPNTVNNFISLVNQGFYDGLIFHRVIPDFMIQGGDPKGNGTGGPGYSIKGEFSENGFENDLKHERGVISMARSQMPDSAGSQFFIMVADAPHLDGEYAPFGKVIEGMDVVDKIVSTDRDENNDKPLKEMKMKQVTVDTKGIDYEEPVKE
ncbi:peptidylprolyl isomerase [Cytobacillus oceanisediminis]|uniref:Peptidyl-prolyl cis-trans isomerase n=2 Tax=Niallia TaxID=2837506 RepID=A0A941GFR7_NIACI|nr:MULTISPECIES: peptidylprolyl isomerase [Bacillaceae]MBQ6446357.1 peptidylprolyl isomerase [Bacillus sp. (in: firmicutes)]MBZ9536801.1 peptidylprolyl isomerase [Cytobacillus oceanisediminis]MCB5238032.1 peptidylprolyl isomerase [Niallia circulans]MED3794081.1 peptidylprolyl isomerase [Niallia alba]NMO77821.1 peptidylprolyl isomerase [Niallia alba]